MSKYFGDLTGVKRLLARYDDQLLTGLKYSFTVRAFRNVYFRKLVSAFTCEKLPKQWVFVVGCYNSGTKLLTNLLAHHPEIASLPQEGRFFTNAFPDLQTGGWRRMMYARRDLWNMSNRDMYATKKLATSDWSPLWSHPASIFIEKSICHATRIPWLNTAFEEERNPVFIGIVRNGYCVAESVRFMGKPIGNAQNETGLSYSISMAAKQWVAINEKILTDMKSVERSILIKLEDLILDPDKIVTRIYEYIGLPVPSICFDGKWILINDFKDEIRADLNQRRLENLSEADIREINPIIFNMMGKLNYEMIPTKMDK